MPMLGLLDESRADYDKKKLKAYKSAEDYRLFVDGHVEELSFNNNEDHQYCIIKSKVKPTQREKTYLKKMFYEVWIMYHWIISTYT